MRSLLAILFAGLLAVTIAPPAAQAQVAESCTVSAWTFHLIVNCSGVLYEYVHLTWCPVHPVIDCADRHVLTCIVKTSRPYLTCPLAA